MDYLYEVLSSGGLGRPLIAGAMALLNLLCLVALIRVLSQASVRRCLFWAAVLLGGAALGALGTWLLLSREGALVQQAVGAASPEAKNALLLAGRLDLDRFLTLFLATLALPLSLGAGLLIRGLLGVASLPADEPVAPRSFSWVTRTLLLAGLFSLLYANLIVRYASFDGFLMAWALLQ